MLLIVGLGNPGGKYANNRHNIGFMAADAIVRRHSFSQWRARFQGEISEGNVGGQKVLVLKPQTYMNDSGRAVGEAARFFKIEPQDVIVLHDELDLAPCKVRVKRGGGHAGHNGLRSIHNHLGTEYARIRLGIGHPGEKDRVTGHVLKDFGSDESKWLDPLLDAVADEISWVIDGDDARFMTNVARAVPASVRPLKKDNNNQTDNETEQS